MKRISSNPSLLSHSRAKCYNHCLRQYYFSYILGLKPKGEEPLPLHIGSVMHDAYEHYHKTFDLEECKDVISREFDGRFDKDITEGLLHIVMDNYASYDASREDWEIVEVFDESQVATIGNLSFIITPDLIVKTSLGYAVVDHKFTLGYLGKRVYERVKYQKQLRMYALGASAILGEDVRHGICNATHVGKAHANAKSKAQLFDRYEFNYSSKELEETKVWLEVTKGEATELEYVAGQYPDFDPDYTCPMNSDAHCKYCDYESLCVANEAQRASRINSNFKVKGNE